jgi:hypothetical protein
VIAGFVALFLGILALAWWAEKRADDFFDDWDDE